MTVSEKLDFWSQRYNFNIQLWGEYNNHCYITKDDVEIKVIPQEKSPLVLFRKIISWCQKSNPRVKYPNQIL